MKNYSIARRLVLTILLVELILTGVVTVGELMYAHAQHTRTFDIMLRGRADSLFGAVQDAEDSADNITLDVGALELPASDIYEVREDSGRLVGRSANWDGHLDGTLQAAISSPSNAPRTIRLRGRTYRCLVMHRVRTIDVDDKPPGIQKPVVIFYAASTKPVWRALRQEARLVVVGDLMVLVLTGIAIVVLLRKTMSPLKELAAQAGKVTARSWSFQAPAEAYAVKELAPLAQALDTAMQGLERSFVQQRNFVGDAAHELKTAVTVVKSSLQLLAYKRRSEQEYKAGLEICLSDCGRMEELVQKMLTLARLEQAEKAGTTTDDVADLSETAREVVQQLQTMAELRQVRIEVVADAGAWVPVSVENLSILLNNLVLNAIQHGGKNSEIHVEVEQGPDYVQLLVKDRGEGIPGQQLPFLFERFYRGDPSRSRNTGGAGLGLSICKALVEASGGNIKIDSAQGEGTKVTVNLARAFHPR